MRETETVTVKVHLKKNTEPTAFTHVLEFEEKIPEAIFSTGHWVNVYPTDLPFVDFDMPTMAYDEKREKVPLVTKFGSFTMSTHTKYLYFHININYMFKEEEEFIKEFEFKV
jgi:hypothetical protein